MKKGVVQKIVPNAKQIEASKAKIAEFEKVGKKIDYEEYFKNIDFDDFVLSDENLKADLEKFVPKPVVRTYDELKREAKKKMIESLGNIKFGFTERNEFFLNEDVELTSFAAKVDIAVLKKCLFEFSFICGNYNRQRKWIRFDDGLYFSLPDLLKDGNHAVLVTYFADKISVRLHNGIDNAVTNVLKKKNMEIVHPDKCFSKGHLIDKENKRVEILNDMKEIFTQMKKPQNDRDFSKVIYIAKVKK